jgi:hypothetical protein
MTKFYKSKLWAFGALAVAAGMAHAACEQGCSGHGSCANVQGECVCFSGFVGAACSERECPYGPAWADVATSTDNAHNNAECSAAGMCNRMTGKCECDEGFEGKSCERLACPNNCSGHGTCLSMSDAATGVDGWHLYRASSYTGWDAEVIHGCLCDSGFSGMDCSKRECVMGVDYFARTAGSSSSIQLYCQCDDVCSGTFGLQFAEDKLRAISPTTSSSALATALMGLSSIKSSSSNLGYSVQPITISMSTGDEVCSSSGVTSTVTFNQDHGDLPLLRIVGNQLSTSVISLQTTYTLTCSCSGVCGGSFRIQGETGEITDDVLASASQGDLVAALESLAGVGSGSVDVSLGGATVCVDATSVATSITISLDKANYPLTVINSLTDGGVPGGFISLLGPRSDRSAQVCCGNGACDFSQGRCDCSTVHWTFGADYGACGSRFVPQSNWVGLERCDGMIPLADSLVADLADIYLLDEGAAGADVTSPGLYWLLGGDDAYATFATAASAAEMSHGIALDMTYRQLYWAQGEFIYRMPIAGDLTTSELATPSTARTTFATLASGEPADYITLDVREGQRMLYWTVPATGKLMRKSLDNANPSEDLTAAIESSGVTMYTPRGLALDLNADTLYYTDEGPASGSANVDGLVVRCKLADFSICDTVVSASSLVDPGALGLDLTTQSMYVLDTYSGSPALYRADMYRVTDASYSMESKVTQVPVTQPDSSELLMSLSAPCSVQVSFPLMADDDTGGATVFFADTDHGTVYKYTPTTGLAEIFLETGAPRSFVHNFMMGYPSTGGFKECSGHGSCSGSPSFRCSCDDGWMGGACSARSCPQGLAWFGEAGMDGSGHRSLAECSAMGNCNSETGECECAPGFEGGACERRSCPDDCSGHGQCLSMRQLALSRVDSFGDPDPQIYSNWDADVVYGCLCDAPGYSNDTPSYYQPSGWVNHKCSERACPYGPNPLLGLPIMETQQLTCSGTGGSFSLAFRSEVATSIPATASPTDLETALESMSSIGDVTLTGGSNPVCTAGGTSTFNIQFATELGNLPLLRLVSNDLTGGTAASGVAITELTPGSATLTECSGHGSCDRQLGECNCFTGWTNSDGSGNLGYREDCGHYIGTTVTVE